MNFNDFLIKLSIFFHDNKLIYGIFSPLYHKYQYHRGVKISKKMNTMFNAYGLDVLKQFDNCMKSNGYNYTLGFGTLLGAVREHGFLKHDFDIDTVMWWDDYNENMTKCLEKVGFKLRHKFSIENDKYGREDCYEKEGVGIDVFYIYPPVEKFPYCCCFVGWEDAPSWTLGNKIHGGALPGRYEFPFNREIKYVKFEDTELPIPVNAEEILTCRYGSDFMTPKTSGWETSPYVAWTEKAGYYYEY